MSQDDSAAVLLACIDAEQLRLREIVSGRDGAMLAARPPNDAWSVVENLRHLLFAEQLHFGRFLPGGPSWSRLGLPPHGMQRQERLRVVGSSPTSNASEVLEAWEAVHDLTRELVRQDTTEMRKALEGNLRHLRAHIKVIERLLRARR